MAAEGIEYATGFRMGIMKQNGSAYRCAISSHLNASFQIRTWSTFPSK